jgi:ABC-2 type transport system permease protein
LLLTFALPIAFVAYLPATVLLGRTGELSIHPLFAYLAPLAGAIVFTLAARFWLSEIRHYQSSGH